LQIHALGGRGIISALLSCATLGEASNVDAVIDLHCHVLPGIDDGPATIEESVAMARVAAEQGTRTIVATPHVNTRYPNRAPAITAAVEALNERLRADDVSLEVRAGAEIAMTSLDELSDDELAALTLGGGSWLLLECPFTLAIDGFAALVRDLRHKGHDVVLAHPERCTGFHRRRDLLEDLVEVGVLTSITAGSLIGGFGKPVRRMAFDMVAAGLVHNVASDAHDPNHRSPQLAGPVNRAGLRSQLDWLTNAVPAAILASTSPPPPPPREAESAGEEQGWRRWFSFGRR
jgi:protein-tyrosine phosphatase